MKKAVCLLLSVIIAAGCSFVCFAAEKTQEPVIIETVYPTDDVVIADVVITSAPYNADNSGESDVTAIIQKAIDDCAANGGGTVFLPVGRYRVTGNIYIRQFVTLRGDYQDPDEGTDYGTIIVADVESSKAMTPGLFTVGASAGAVGLTVWYPNQSIDNVKPYPYTFYITGNNDYMLQTIENCTLINSYRGIGACSECENGVYQCHEMLTVENVKGTCLYEGLNSYNSADVDTYKTLYILNKYWLEAGEEFNAPSKEKLDEYTKRNGYGLVIGDLEWPQFADIKIDKMQYGILFKEPTRYSFSGEFVDLYITDCVYGVYAPEDIIVHRGTIWGTGISNSVIEGEKYAIYDPGKAAMLLTNVEISGRVKGKNIHRYYADTSEYTPDYDKGYQKCKSDVLYVVEADKSGKTDASQAVQQKLNEAATTGGVVYLPGGLYRFDNPITVPAGVELRGSSSVATRCQGGNSSGTLIISYYGYKDGDSPLITLGGNGAGFNGIRVDYPLNNPVDDSGKYSKTSSVVYSEADNIYVTNCCFTLASSGITLNGCKNVFIKKVLGCCYESMFSFEACNSVFVEGCLQNANTLPRNGYANFDIPELINRFEEKDVFTFVFDPITRVTTDYIKLDTCTEVTIFNTFIYGGKCFLNSVNSEAIIVNVGHDGSSKTVPALVMSGGEITLLNSMRSTSTGNSGYRFYEIENSTKFRSYNSQSVDMLYREHIILKNVCINELNKCEFIYYLLQPIYRIITLFGKLFMLEV
ncbi:MAG: hypothetical protein IJZ88_04900 [Clostridia bacterium]|nr:hypothetical protein [Clostridia bacterium]